MDREVRSANVQDGGTARIAGFPYLRTDRFHASLKDRAIDGAPFEAWVERLRRLDSIARQAEWANLPGSRRAELASRFPELHDQRAEIERCGDLLVRTQLSSPAQRDALRKNAIVADDYDTWKRVAGVYALTRVPFAAGIRRYEAATAAVFAKDAAALPVHGRLAIYAADFTSPLDAQQIEAILRASGSNPLGIPEPAGADLERLFDTFAPAFAIDEVDDNDRIGTLTLSEHGSAQVDTATATVYRRLAYTRFGNDVLLQLVYSVWLPARPQSGAFDLLGGSLDGVTWRVTLDRDGAPLLFDSIHNCGCYHQFFPTRRVRLKPQRDTIDEKAFVPQWLPVLQPGERATVRLASRTHYIERIAAEEPTSSARRYVYADDDTLRSLERADGARGSPFRSDGIVSGSQRGERWLFWPMGVREPGAMRQWGRHATAFVGRRHFDDADLLERYFERAP